MMSNLFIHVLTITLLFILQLERCFLAQCSKVLRLIGNFQVLISGDCLIAGNYGIVVSILLTIMNKSMNKSLTPRVNDVHNYTISSGYSALYMYLAAEKA